MAYAFTLGGYQQTAGGYQQAATDTTWPYANSSSVAASNTSVKYMYIDSYIQPYREEPTVPTVFDWLDQRIDEICRLGIS